MSIRKIYKSGNSLVVVLSPDILKETRIDLGDYVVMKAMKKGYIILSRPELIKEFKDD